jgi:AraC-like DNA-binding protein
LLTVTNIKVTAIAEMLGYADPSGFTRAFER